MKLHRLNRLWQTRHKSPASRLREFTAAMATADALRDAGKPAQAAEAYRRAVGLDPEHWRAWVQLGNMLKDDGEFEPAVEAYRRAISIEPNDSDAHAQLGRALRGLGLPAEAAWAWSRALELDPDSRDAMSELQSLDESALEATQSRAMELVQARLDRRNSGEAPAGRVGIRLPGVVGLFGFPLERYDLFRRVYSVGAPPLASMPGKLPTTVAVLLVATPGDPTGLDLCLESIGAQHGVRVVAAGVVADDECARSWGRRAGVDARFRISARMRAADAANGIKASLRLVADALAEAELLLVVDRSIVLDRFAAAWLAWAFGYHGVVAAYCDGDRLVAAGPGRSPSRVDPEFRPAYDPDGERQGLLPGPLLAVRRDCLIAWLDSPSEATETLAWQSELMRYAAASGGIAHVPRVLASRIRGDGELGINRSELRAACPADDDHPLKGTIEIVIPTRDEAELLARCIETLRARAEDPSRLVIHVVDTGSTQPATHQLLAQEALRGSFEVTRIRGPFNWSAANNIAVADSRAEVFVFANNDIELLTDGWDTLLRKRLAEPQVGVVGGLLKYPDQRLQHAGIVLGHEGRTEHEGRFAPGTSVGPMGRYRRVRAVAATTGALLACRAEMFRAVEGFDAVDLAIWYNDVDFCLRVRACGARVVLEPRLQAIHHESVTIHRLIPREEGRDLFEAATELMRSRWGRSFSTDPYYNPHFARRGTPFRFIREPSLRDIVAHVEASLEVSPVRSGAENAIRSTPTQNEPWED